MKSGRRMKKTKNNNRIIKKISIFIIILCIACIILINNKENINLYYKASANPLQYTSSTNVDLQNPSFEVDSFDDTKEVTYNKSLTGWKTPSNDGIIGVKYNPNFTDNTQYFFELDESKENSLFYNVQLEENTDYNWSIVHRSRTFKGESGYCTAAVIIGPEQEVEPSKNSIDLQDQFMKITTWLKENDNMKVEGMTGISEEHVVYTSKFTTNGGFNSESFSLEPTDECTEKWSVWLAKDSVYCFEEYNVQFNSNNISDAVVAISYFDTTLSDKSCGNLIKEFKIYNDNVDVLNMSAEEVYENNKTLLSTIDSKGYATLPSANSASATVKEGIWNSTEASKKLEIGMYNSSKNVYGLVSLSSINASEGEIEHNKKEENIHENIVVEENIEVSDKNEIEKIEIVEKKENKTENQSVSEKNNTSITETSNKANNNVNNKETTAKKNTTTTTVSNNANSTSKNEEKKEPIITEKPKEDIVKEEKTTTDKVTTNNTKTEEIIETPKCKHSNENYYNTEEEAIAFYKKTSKEYGDKVKSGEITYEEYLKKCPYGYETMSCPYCQKWTISFYYE